MLFFIRTNRLAQLPQFYVKTRIRFITSTACLHHSTLTEPDVATIARIINDCPFLDQQLHGTLSCHIPPAALSTVFVDNVLGHLFGAHCNGLKAYEFFKFSLNHTEYVPNSGAFEKTLHILTRMRYFNKAWELMESIAQRHPSLLTLKSMSIVLSRIAKFQSYEDTVKAFEKMEKDIFIGRMFGTDEFNVLLRAFCTERQMMEARSIFNKFHSRFSPDAKSMNILLLGFKESGDITSVELFYHEMVRRGFKPNGVTYSVRIDAYCKKGCFGDAVRLLDEMEQANCMPTLETITTLIHGAGIVRNISKAKEMFSEIAIRGLQADTGAYNALISSLIRCRDVKSAAGLMDEMDKRSIRHDTVTYHLLFFGYMRSKSRDGVSELYQKMIARNFVPKTRTVVMLMKFFCENRQLDLALSFWRYLVGRGRCPHSHALDLLVTGLCSHGKISEAFECSKHILEKGRQISGPAFQMLERFLLQGGEENKVQELDSMMKRLQLTLPSARGHGLGISVSTT